MPPPKILELDELERVIALAGQRLEVHVAATPDAGDGRPLPVYALALGNPSPGIPAVGFFGGVHGLERIGTQVVTKFLDQLVARLAWDVSLHDQLEKVRLVFMPLVNPGGMLRGTRANPHGVDLMRNAPLDAREPVPFLVGGQRISAGLPWYRGRRGAPMEEESRALCELVERELLARPFSLALDCHSGFGIRDRLWFPYAHSRAPIPHLPHLHALAQIFQASNANHPYLIEPQSRQYLAHGDLWDYLYLNAARQARGVFLPLTLEMGSWLWIRKNPRQVFSRGGIFNPLIAHREQRVLRRHFALLDFIVRAAAGHRRWLPDGEQCERLRRLAMTSRAPDRHRAGLARWEAIATERPVTRLNALRQLAAVARYAPPPQGPGAPMLLLASERDQLVSPQCSQRFARRWDLPLRLHPWAGHDLPLDDPAWVVEQIAGWRFAASPETI